MRTFFYAASFAAIANAVSIESMDTYDFDYDVDMYAQTELEAEQLEVIAATALAKGGKALLTTLKDKEVQKCLKKAGVAAKDYLFGYEDDLEMFLETGDYAYLNDEYNFNDFMTQAKSAGSQALNTVKSLGKAGLKKLTDGVSKAKNLVSKAMSNPEVKKCL